MVMVFTVKDAATSKPRLIKITPDSHGAVINIEGCAEEIVLDLSENRLGVFVSTDDSDMMANCCYLKCEGNQ